ncbi:carboxypeptidase C [Atractiella rhizophila]|nr:carboxypeptidase C [Atractiella rhizophila]
MVSSYGHQCLSPLYHPLLSLFLFSLSHRRDTGAYSLCDVLDELVTHAAFPEHHLKLKEPKLCDSTVNQWSGYFEVAEKHHLFFWFFESRSDPTNDPLVLWLNGTRLLGELGPCNIAEGGNSTEYNQYGWNAHANLLFLDQPVNVGYSWTDGEEIMNSWEASEDFYVFLQLFYSRFPALKQNKFTLAGESYGGTYVPTFSRKVWDKNQELRNIAVQNRREVIEIPLESIMIGNGLSDPLLQTRGDWIYACQSPYAMLNRTNDLRLDGKHVPICEQLLKICYENPTERTCGPAIVFCALSISMPVYELNTNPYDVREKCDIVNKGVEDCAHMMGPINNYLNKPSIKAELGVPEHVGFTSCNGSVGINFQGHFDSYYPHENLLIDMLEGGLRVLIYVGEDDYICNYEGNKLWMEALESSFKEEFNNAPTRDFVPQILKGKKGSVRTAGMSQPHSGNFTFLTIEEAGHMVPTDQPVASLDMLERWLKNVPLY